MTPLTPARRPLCFSRYLKVPVSRCFTADRQIRENDVIILREQIHGKTDRFYLSPPLKPETRVKTRSSRSVRGSDIIGKHYRDLVCDERNCRYRLHEPSLAAYTLLRPRLVTPIYPGDANTLVSILDLHLPSPGEDAQADGGPPLEIFEAGTGHGSLTLHLARAIHGANPPVPPTLRAALAGADYVPLPKKPVRISEETRAADAGREADADVSAPDEGSEEVYHPFTTEAAGHDVPHPLILPDAATVASHEAYLRSRRAVIHTLDMNRGHSRLAHRNALNFRRAQYLLDVDFHVGTLHDHLRSRLDRAGGRPFLSHAILDLPGLDKAALGLMADAMHKDGLLLVFCPSITQIADCVAAIAELGGPRFLTDRVIELPTSTYDETGGNKGLFTNSPLSGRDWSVEPVFLPESQAGAAGNLRKVFTCRPKVGGRVVGGGFVGVFRRLLDVGRPGGRDAADPEPLS